MEKLKQELLDIPELRERMELIVHHTCGQSCRGGAGLFTFHLSAAQQPRMQVQRSPALVCRRSNRDQLLLVLRGTATANVSVWATHQGPQCARDARLLIKEEAGTLGSALRAQNSTKSISVSAAALNQTTVSLLAEQIIILLY